MSSARYAVNTLEFVRRNILIFVYPALILSTLLVFWQVRNFDFVNYDDKVYVSENPHVLNGLTKSGVVWAFTKCHYGYWQPLTWLSLMLDCQLFGPSPGWVHLVNVFLHTANALLLFSVLKKMTGSLWPSAFVAALFAIHPMHVESVAWISERKDVLSTLFLLLTLFAYTGYVKCNTGFQLVQARPGWPCYITALVFFALGLMAKPILVTVPFLLLLLDYWPLNRFLNSKFSILNYIIEKIPFFVLSVVFSVITFLTQKAGSVIFDTKTVPLTDRVGNAFLSYARYIIKLFVPRNMSVFYPYDVGSITFRQAAMCLVFLIVITVLVIYFGRRRKYLAVGWCWFIGTLLPVIGLVTFTGSSYADRFTYMPYTGLFIIIAWGLPELFSGWRYRKIFLGAAASMTLTALWAITYRQAGVWNNSITLFSHALKVTHNNAVVHNYLGNSYFDLKRYEDAMESFRQAVSIMPDYAEAHYNLGNACLNLGRYQEAIEAYKQAIKIKKDYAEAYNNLGNARVALGLFQEAAESFKQAINIKPDFADAYNNLGNACLSLERLQDAIENYKQAIRVKPNYSDAYYNLGVAFNNTGRRQESIDAFKQAISIKPDFADAHYELGVTYGVVGRYQESIDSFKRAIGIKQDWADAHFNLGLTYLITGDKDSAVREYDILKNLDAKYADQLYNLIKRETPPD